MDLHSVKVRLQEHLSDGLVTIIGSGLSCAEGLPGMGELATHLLAEVGGGLTGADATAWASTSALISTKGLEAALLAVPPTQVVELAIAAATGKLIAERERVVVSEVFAGTRKLRLTRLPGCSSSVLMWAIQAGKSQAAPEQHWLHRQFKSREFAAKTFNG
jgi:hypothetical protein